MPRILKSTIDRRSHVQDARRCVGLADHGDRALLTAKALASPPPVTGPLTAALFGSAVHDVLRNTDRPVLLVGPHVETGDELCPP